MSMFPKFLTYGNWGGPGWSGGKFVENRNEVDWSVPPIDQLDSLFRQHDFLYQHSTDSYFKIDFNLLRSIYKCKKENKYAMFYSILVFISFTAKLVLLDPIIDLVDLVFSVRE